MPRRIADSADPDKGFFLYLVGSVYLFGLSSEVFSDLILNELGQKIEEQWRWAFKVVVFIVALLVLSAVTNLSNIYERFTQKSKRPQLENVYKLDPNQTSKGLMVIASIGPGISSAKAAIAHHWQDGNANLKHCWIISAGQGSLDSARDLAASLIKEGLASECLHYDEWNMSASDADNPLKMFELVNRIYQDASGKGLKENEVTADYTGGTKSMTAGMVLACTTPQRELQFIRPRQYQANGQADYKFPSDPYTVDIRFQPLRLAR